MNNQDVVSAILAGHVGKIAAFHRDGFDFDQIDPDSNMSYAMWSAQSESPDMMHAVHAAGADFTKPNAAGIAPAHIIAQAKNQAMFHTASIVGVDFTAKTNDGARPIDYAPNSENKRTITTCIDLDAQNERCSPEEAIDMSLQILSEKYPAEAAMMARTRLAQNREDVGDLQEHGDREAEGRA